MSSLPSFVTRFSDALNVLLVGTAAADRDVLEQALLECRVQIAACEDEALQILRDGTPRHHRPQLVIIDWALPSGGAERLLSRIKSEPSLQPLPVAVLSDPSDADAVRKAYDLKASCVVSRGSDSAETRSRFLELLEFWARTAQVPRFSCSGRVS